MKKMLLLLLLMLFPAGFSCYSSAVTISANNSLETVYAMLLLNSRYNHFENNSFSYYSLNDSSAKIKVFPDSIVIQSFDESSDWHELLHSELYELWIYSATSLDEEEIIFLSNQGCCGSYDNGKYVNIGQECIEEIVIPERDESGLLAVYFSIIPFLVILFYFARRDFRKYLAFMVGAFGWLIAFILRLPVLSRLSLINELWILILVPALMSGLFEEVLRYFFLKYLSYARKNFFLFAMGWSFCEIVIIYAFSLYSYLMLNQQLSFLSALPGLVERLSGTIIHLSLTLIVLKSIGSKKFLALAILLHAGINLLASFMLLNNANIWLIEAVLLVVAGAFYYFAEKFHEKGDSYGRRRADKKNKRKR